MQSYKQQFIKFALEYQVLKFGEFTLKSGRKSPYFFNAGLFNDGAALAKLGEFYAAALIENDLKCDIIFGPAYKGIPLAATTAIALANQYHTNLPYSFNRKEAKDHGEGGNIVGAPLKGKVLIIDDVITAGTAIREAIDIIKAHGATVGGIAIALDRQEKGRDNNSAINEIATTYNIPVINIISFTDLIEYVGTNNEFTAIKDKLEAYRQQYGV